MTNNPDKWKYAITWPMPWDLESFFSAGADRHIPEFVRSGEFVRSLNLGAGRKLIGGSEPLDLPEWDGETQDIPASDSSVGTIYAFHFLEHLPAESVIRVLRECQRVLVSGGQLNVVVPHRLSQGAYHDLDHKTFWTEETWRNLFHNSYSNKNGMRSGWEFHVGLNLMIGLNERNLMLVTQLIRN
jgi:SAM-dependent methyltransferase